MPRAPRIRLAALGAVQVFRDGTEIELPGRRPQLMLALLLAHVGRTVGVAEVISLLWATEPPANAVNMVRQLVGRIRRTLEPGLPFRAEGSWVAGVPGGYRLRADPDGSDVVRFRALAERATGAAGPAEALPDWIAALSLWRGRYAHGLAGVPGPAPFAALDRERASAAVAAATAARRIGASGAVLALVQAVAEQNPLDEALAAAVVGLLVAEGRTAEATAWYQRTSGILDEHLGVAPGPGLTAALHGVVPRSSEPRPVAYPKPAQLPSDLWLFGGRQAEMEALSAAADRRVGVIAIDGIPGIGKSTLAVHWAHASAGRFPDGQLFTNLRGYDPAGQPADPGDVLAGFLDSLGVPPPRIPPDPASRAGLFRTLTASRRLLVVLDNARSVEQVRPLIPAGSGSLALITSRTRLSGLATHDGATLVGLDLPDPVDAREDLRRRVDPSAVLRDEDLDRVVDYSGRLPLAVSIVAARARAHSGTIDELLVELRESRDTLDAFDDDGLGGVRSVFSWSYRQLGPEAARLFRLLSAHAGPDAGLPLLASLAGVSHGTADRLVRELTRTRLLSEPRPGRFSRHDLIAVYAAELSEELDHPAERERAAARIFDHFTRTIDLINRCHLSPLLRTITGAPLAGVGPEEFPDAPAALNWLRAELENVSAALAGELRRGRNPWPTLVDAFAMYVRIRRIADLELPVRQALAAAVAAADRPAEAHMRKELAWIAGLYERDEESAAGFERARAIFESLGADVEQAAIYLNIAERHSLASPPDYAGAVAPFERALALFRANRHEAGVALTLGGLGRCRLELGRIEEGTASLTEALEFYLRAGKIYRTAALFWHLGAAGKRSDAADFLLMSYRLYSTSEHDYWAMITGLALAEEYARAGRPWDALAAWRRASHFLAASAEHGPIPPDIPERLDRLGDDLRRHFGGTSPSVPHHKIPIASDPAAVRAGGDGRIESNGDDDDDDEDGGE